MTSTEREEQELWQRVRNQCIEGIFWHDEGAWKARTEALATILRTPSNTREDALEEAARVAEAHIPERNGSVADLASRATASSIAGAIRALNQSAESANCPDLARAVEVEARDILSSLSSYLGAGMGDDATTLAQFDDRIRWGIDHIGSVYRHRAAEVVEECSKRPGTTWGQVKRAILDDTCLPTAARTTDPIHAEKGEG